MINGQVVRTVSLNADDNRWHDTVIADLQLKPGDVITLKGSGTGCEYAILDSIRLCPSEPVDPGTAALGDRVFHDTNRNGVQDAGEAGVAGVAVTLYDAAGQAIGSTVTDANGNYLFDDLKAGTYSVGFQEADGFDFTTRDAGGNDARDSDANQTTGRTGPVTLRSARPTPPSTPAWCARTPPPWPWTIRAAPAPTPPRRWTCWPTTGMRTATR